MWFALFYETFYVVRTIFWAVFGYIKDLAPVRDSFLENSGDIKLSWSKLAPSSSSVLFSNGYPLDLLAPSYNI
jgi:hypothetical protein